MGVLPKWKRICTINKWRNVEFVGNHMIVDLTVLLCPVVLLWLVESTEFYQTLMLSDSDWTPASISREIISDESVMNYFFDNVSL